MPFKNIQEALNEQIKIDNFLKSFNIKNLIGDYGELLIQRAKGGERQTAVNQGFDIMHKKYGRIEVKTRKYKINKDGKIRQENRAVGFGGKENSFDWLAHVVLDVDFTVKHACLAKYSEVWPIIQKSGKISYQTSSNLDDSEDITDEVIKVQREINAINS